MGSRPPNIPTVRNRITQTAIKIIMEPIFEPQFKSYSLDFRLNKSAHDAVDEVVKYLNFGCESIIDADITECFDNMDKHGFMDIILESIGKPGHIQSADRWDK